MTLTQAITIFEAFDKWSRLPGNPLSFTEYTNIQVLEAQAIILNEAQISLARRPY